MYVKHHIILGGLFSLILFLVFPAIGLIEFSLIFLSSFLIDVDHYTYYVYKKKDLSLKKAYKWFMKMEKKLLSLPRNQRNKISSNLVFLHGIEMLILLFLLGFVSKYFFFIFIGFSFHLLLDMVKETSYHDRIDKFSLIYDYFKFKKLKKLEI